MLPLERHPASLSCSRLASSVALAFPWGGGHPGTAAENRISKWNAIMLLPVQVPSDNWQIIINNNAYKCQKHVKHVRHIFPEPSQENWQI